MKYIALADLRKHPRNPRLAPRQDIVEQIAAQIVGGLDEAHALIVRPVGDVYEIISGHHRFLAARQAGLDAVPCWVREMSDDEAYMALALFNAQSELSPIERGMHALHSGKDVKAYAASVGRARTTVHDEVYAAEVIEAVPHMRNDLTGYFRHLTEIHAAPRWLWPALVSALVTNEWTVEATRKAVSVLKDIAEPPEWSDRAVIAHAVISGALKPSEVARFGSAVEKTTDALTKGKDDAERLAAELVSRLAAKRPEKLSEVSEICIAIEHEQAALIKERQQADLLRTKRDEEIAARIARLRISVSLEEWKTLAKDEQNALLSLSSDDVRVGSFNKQENDAIEWAQWSWNPVTGCLHECPYCYARDIANSAKMAQVYPNGFDPTFRPASLLVPLGEKIPKEAARDTRFKNVFTCSMSDLFGRWVPAEWINAVLNAMRSAPQWNFLCLTKFPKRMAEFDIPPNAWMGTTVDLQARVKNAESAFERVTAGVRWLSVEPMIEPLNFSHLDRFQWIVIGGASRSSGCPEWQPPFQWIADLVQQARDAGVAIYMKTNLGIANRIVELPFDAPVDKPPQSAPRQFQYLKARNNTDAT